MMPFDEQKDPKDYDTVFNKTDIVVSWIIGFIVGMLFYHIMRN
jgi:hypothetical protein